MQVNRGKIVVLGTGGTIAGTASSAHDHVGYTAAQLGVADLIAAIGVDGSVPLEVEQVAQADSKNMDFVIWRKLAQRCAHWLANEGVRGIVITHGTDTLEETAFFLQSVLAPPKPVVLTCAMRPATALGADGPQNLVDAISVASSPQAHGVVAVCAGVVHGARDVAKSHTYRLDAFTSGDAGALGYVEEGQLRLVRGWPERGAADAALLRKVDAARAWPRVEIVMNYAGGGAGLVDALLAQGVDGIVAAGTGNGGLNDAMEAALVKAQAGGVRVVRATRCAAGTVIARPGDVLSGSQGLSAVKARVAMILQLLA